MSCQGICAELHFLDGSEAWSEKCPTCQTWVVFRNGGCACCGTLREKFEFRESHRNIIREANDQIDICTVKKQIQLLYCLYRAKKPLNTTTLLRAAHKSYKYRKKLNDLISHGAIDRYMVTGLGCYEYRHQLMKMGMDTLKLYCTFKIFNPDWIFPEDIIIV